MKNRSLYEINEDFEALDALLEEIEGDVSDEEVHEAIMAWQERLQGELTDKLENYARYIRSCEMLAANYKEEEKRLRNLSEKYANRAARIKERLLVFMQENGMRKANTPHFELSVRANGGKLPISLFDVPEGLPEEYQKVKVEADMEAIRRSLEAGQELEFATLGERGSHLRLS